MKLGLVFEGGGGKGAYQIGVWKALHEIGLDKHIAAVSGTSVGALNAFLFAYGDYDLALKIWTELTPLHVFTPLYMCADPERVLTSQDKFLWDLFLKRGLFTRKGLEIIFSHLDFNRVGENNAIPCYATCLKVDDIKDVKKFAEFCDSISNRKSSAYLLENPEVLDSFISMEKFKKNPYKYSIKRLLGIQGNIKFFKVNHYSESIKKEILLASSAIPWVFQKQPIEGAYYIDGGVEENIPMAPLLVREKCDTVFVVMCNRDSEIPKKYHKYRIFPIIPKESQNGVLGTFDFTKDGINRRITQGYNDAKMVFRGIYDIIEIIKQYNCSTDKSETENDAANVIYL